MRNNNYPNALRGLDVPIVVVGVTYDAKTKAHRCRIDGLDEWHGSPHMKYPAITIPDGRYGEKPTYT